MGARAIAATIDFGANAELGAHCFRIRANAEQVHIVEDYGFHRPDAPEELRAVLPVAIFDAVKTFVRKEFNSRTLRERSGTRTSNRPYSVGVANGRATFKAVGETLADRLLGRELCVLAWLLEDATSDTEVGSMLKIWQGLRPEERWWLAQTVIDRGASQVQARRGLRILLAPAGGQ